LFLFVWKRRNSFMPKVVIKPTYLSATKTPKELIHKPRK